MLNYLLRRLLIAIPVLLGILVMSFVLVRLVPGDPLLAMMGVEIRELPPELLERRRQELGLDGPIWVQFAAWLRELAQGNLGFSYQTGRPVLDMIAERLGPTAQLAFGGIAVALVVGVPAGIAAALKRNRLFDNVSAALSMATISVPSFFLALIAIYVFSLQLGLLPSSGMRPLTTSGGLALDALRYYVLPVGVLASFLVASYVRFTRQSMLEVLGQEYMIAATAKGLTRSGVVISHGLRNALVPLVTVIALQIPGLLAGTVIIESVFSWPGLGRLTLNAISSRDYPVITALVLLSAILVMTFNLLADLAAAALDPRIRL